MDIQKLTKIRAELDYLSSIIPFIGLNNNIINITQKKLTELAEIRIEFPTETIESISVEPVINVQQVKHSPIYNRNSKKISSNTSYNPERYVPFKVLWAKVIIRAAYDYALWKDSKDIRLRKCAQEAEQWLFESSSLELGFENICFAFDFPIERIRSRTRVLTRDDVKKLEFLERHTKNDIIGDTQDGGVE